MDLSRSPVTVMLPVRDMTRTRRFHEEQLALTTDGERPEGRVVYRCGGTEIALFPRAEGTKAEHTAISFRVEEIRDRRGTRAARRVLRRLRSSRLQERRPRLRPRFRKAAWFSDPEGNILCLHEDIAGA